MWQAAAAAKDERREGGRSDMRGTFMGGPSNGLHLWDVADRDAISVKALQIHQPAREEVAYVDGSDLAVFVEFLHCPP